MYGPNMIDITTKYAIMKSPQGTKCILLSAYFPQRKVRRQVLSVKMERTALWDWKDWKGNGGDTQHRK